MALLEEGKNCWRQTRASHGRFLIDGKEYFSEVFRTLLNAKSSIFIVGWDIDSRVQLLRPEERVAGVPTRLLPLLNYVVEKNKNLHVYVLIWDSAPFFMLNREPFLKIKLGWNTHHRLHFCKDSRHPLFACHHQKLVVVDDSVAFCGGLDLTRERWDTPEHNPNDHLRSLDGHKCPPFHDVQMKVVGETAQVLGELARQRWKHATGIWPEQPVTKHMGVEHSSQEWDFTDAPVAIALSQSGFTSGRNQRDIMRAYVDMIDSAKSVIYVENQYFCSQEIAKALERALQKPSGPEVILVLPQSLNGRFENLFLDPLRQSLVQRLLLKDRFGRFGAFYPTLPSDGEVKVHSKVMVVDDRVACVGSANLTLRSMGLDTECMLILNAEGEQSLESAVRRFRSRLLAEHLSLDVHSIVKSNESSILSLILSRKGHPRSLQPIPVKMSTRNYYWRERIIEMIERPESDGTLRHLQFIQGAVSWRVQRILLIMGSLILLLYWLYLYSHSR